MAKSNAHPEFQSFPSEEHSILSWAQADLPLAGVEAALREAGLAPVDPVLPAEAGARAARLQELGRVQVGITAALAGLADTGSLALLSGPGRPRTASLLPPVHLALLPAERLFPGMAHFLRAHPGLTREESNLVFVTGPSRTADIELTLTRGVHGPGSLHILLLPPAPAMP